MPRPNTLVVIWKSSQLLSSLFHVCVYIYIWIALTLVPHQVHHLPSHLQPASAQLLFYLFHCSRRMAVHSGFWFGADVEILFSGWPLGHGHFHFYLALLLVFMLSMVAQMYAMTPMSTPKIVPKSLINHAALHGLRTLIAYLVLLCVITFNVGVIITVLLGHVAGYLALTLYIKYYYPVPVATPPADDAKA